MFPMSQKEPQVFTDYLAFELDPSWSWIREESSGWKIAEDGLFIRSQPGSLWANNNDAKNVLVRPVHLEQNVLLTEVLVKSTPLNSGAQGGLIWYIHDDHYIKLVKELVDQEHVIVLALEVNGQPEVFGKVPVDTDTARIQLSLSGNTVMGLLQQTDGDEWQLVGYCPPIPHNNLQIGLVSHGGTSEEADWVRMSNFRMVSS
jgi:regulation of enolase protein 1 (concanavalin A-like superfamily)